MSSEPEAPRRPRVRMLCAVNYRLPPHDYRIHYAALSTRCAVEFALPEPPATHVRWHRLELREGVRGRDIIAFATLGRLLASMRGTGTIAHFFSTKLVLVGPVLARLAGLRCMVTVTGFGRTFSDARLRYRLLQLPYRILFQLSASLADIVLFQNRGDLDAMRRRHPRLAPKFRFIGSATAARGSSGPKPSTPPLRVLHVGRLLRSKGVLDFLHAARVLQGERFTFVLAGPSSASEPETARLVSQANDAGTIDYLGALSSDELDDVYANAHVIAFLSHAEGMSRVLLEAGMNTLCPLAYDIPANRDVVPDGIDALVPLGAVDQVVARLQALGRDDDERTRCADAFACFVRSEFAVDRYVARLDDFVAETCCGPAGP